MCSIAAILRRVPLTVWPVVACLALFGSLYAIFHRWNRHARSFYLDPQDFVAYEGGGGRELPVAAAKGTFAPLLNSYVDITKLLITVAAASIAFGGGQNPRWGVIVAKIVLAFSILYGVTFAALLQFFYDQYCIDVRFYTRPRYSLIEALGFSTLACFIGGYFFWAFNLS